jgi:hypothetical protein
MADPAPPSPEALVARLLAAVGGDAPMAEAVDLLAPDVVCHMDRFTARGVDAWVDWVEFIRSRGVADVKVQLDRLETAADGIVTAHGRLTGGAGAKPAAGGAAARYRVVDGRIVEIWTDRLNYEMIFGAKVRHPRSWLLVLLWMAIWRRLPWRRRANVPHRSGAQ